VQVAQREEVIQAQRGVTARRQQQSQQQRLCRDGLHVRDNVVHMDLRKFPVQQPRHAREHEQRSRGPCPAARPTAGSHRLCRSTLRGHRCGPSASQGFVADTVWLRRVFATTPLIILGVLLIVAFKEDHFGIAFKREDVGRNAVQEPAIV
jgi:hypothetical protein